VEIGGWHGYLGLNERMGLELTLLLSAIEDLQSDSAQGRRPTLCSNKDVSIDPDRKVATKHISNLCSSCSLSHCAAKTLPSAVSDDRTTRRDLRCSIPTIWRCVLAVLQSTPSEHEPQSCFLITTPCERFLI